MSETEHFNDLCDIQDKLADIQQLAQLAATVSEKLNKLHAEIRIMIGKCECITERK